MLRSGATGRPQDQAWLEVGICCETDRGFLKLHSEKTYTSIARGILRIEQKHGSYGIRSVERGRSASNLDTYAVLPQNGV